MADLNDIYGVLKEILNELQLGRKMSEEVIKENELNASKMEGELKGMVNSMIAYGIKPTETKEILNGQ